MWRTAAWRVTVLYRTMSAGSSRFWPSSLSGLVAWARKGVAQRKGCGDHGQPQLDGRMGRDADTATQIGRRRRATRGGA